MGLTATADSTSEWREVGAQVRQQVTPSRPLTEPSLYLNSGHSALIATGPYARPTPVFYSSSQIGSLLKQPFERSPSANSLQTKLKRLSSSVLDGSVFWVVELVAGLYRTFAGALLQFEQRSPGYSRGDDSGSHGQLRVAA